jgi:hypothetical protein
VTLCRLVAVPLEVVVELELLSNGNVFCCKEADLELAFYNPLLRLAVWFAAVVDEARPVAPPTRINHLYSVAVFAVHVATHRVVVKLKRIPKGGVFFCREEADLELALDGPLLRLTVWFAAVVDEARPVTPPTRIDHLHDIAMSV